MAGIYIHIPFCRQKCHYCNFYAVASKKYRNDFVASLINEIKSRVNYLEGEDINTIYLGGGTPSLLNTKEIQEIFTAIQENYTVDPGAEITLEANPDDLNSTKLNQLRNETPVNRLSIGVQSFFDDDLKYLNRVHDGLQAGNAIKEAKKQGFNNLTIDLIYGIPSLTEKKWNENLDIFFSFDLPHLSSYSLTIEPKTPLKILIEKGKIKPTDEEQSISHFRILLDKTASHGFVHYEISNFATPGHYSKHNSIYWLGGHYVGFGPSAHSYNGISRQWNVLNMKEYIEADKVDKIIAEKEVLTIDQRFNEYVMTSIRTSWGCDAEHIRNVFGMTYLNHFDKNIATFLSTDKVYKKGSQYFLTAKGKLFADAIAAELFV